MTETKTNRKKVAFFKEKKWIIAYWFKVSRKAQFTEKYLWELWRKWWGNDFTDMTDERFQGILPWIREVKQTMTKEEIKKKRHDFADNRPIPQYIKKLAAQKGYYVKKCSTRNHPLKVSGYAIFKNPRDKRAIYGGKFNLTVKQVEGYLTKKEDK